MNEQFEIKVLRKGTYGEEMVENMKVTLEILWRNWVIGATKAYHLERAWGMIHGFRVLLIGEIPFDVCGDWAQDMAFLCELIAGQFDEYLNRRKV